MPEFYTDVTHIGNFLYVRGYDESGERFQTKIKYSPQLFIADKNCTGEYKDIHGNPVKPKKFPTIRDAKDFMNTYGDVHGMKIFGLDRWEYTYINEHYRNVDPNSNLLKIAFLDIEVRSDDGFPKPEDAVKEILTITVVVDEKAYVFGMKDYRIEDKNTFYVKCENEVELLKKFIGFWKKLDPDVLTGWYTEFFDIPYMVNRITQVLGEDKAKELSPWKRLYEYTINDKRKLQSYKLTGIACLDYLSVYKKFRLKPRDNYKLDYIAEVELGEKKLDYGEYENLSQLYDGDFQHYVNYNIRDSKLVQRLEDKLGYINQIFTLSYDAGVNFNDALTTLTIWDVFIHNYLMKRKLVVPTINNNKFRKIAGGFVKESIVGMHKWIMSFDLDSLYPHLIMQYNISPDMHVPCDDELDECLSMSHIPWLLEKKADLSVLKKRDLTMTANGQFYRRDKKGFLTELMETMYDDRKKFKKRMLKLKRQQEEEGHDDQRASEIIRCHNMQYALKILLNSAYGAIANQYFRWYEADNAEAITLSGQLSIKWIEKKINEYMNKLLKTDVDYVVHVDTDSVYVRFDELVKKVYEGKNPDRETVIDFLDNVAEKKIRPYINKCYKELAEYMNAYQQKMSMKREVIANKGIWTAKKRYVLNVYDDEGVRLHDPDLKMLGIEAVRSSTSPACREYIKKALRIVMDGTEEELQDFIRDARKDFMTLPFEKIACPRGVSFVSKSTQPDGSVVEGTYADPHRIYKKGTPIAVKGALIYNHYLNKMGLDKKYETIKEGDKIKFCYLKLPNKMKDKVIACPQTLPPEFQLDDYLDRELQFEKNFIDPICVIIHTIDWEHEKRSTLEAFFK